MLDHEQSYNTNLLSEQILFQNIGGNIAFKRLLPRIGRAQRRLPTASARMLSDANKNSTTHSKTVRLNASQRYEWSFWATKYPVRPLGRTIFIFAHRQKAFSFF